MPPLCTILERVGLQVLTDDDHQAVLDLTRHRSLATLRRFMGRLERTRTAAAALRADQVRPVCPVVRRSHP
ncbi:hypothetical protein ACFQ6N_17575 [Kitasatospora sp. NPDC056446]|uniref:hypothetical protein n=1 Tax=Kitasatospora sp. NPDC056446 TaxID=3345819 RepID=UPI0036CCCE10